MRALAFGNRRDDELGRIGEWTQQQGFAVETVHREDLGSPLDPTAYDLVISLGSSWSLCSQEVHAHLAPELDALRSAVAASVPVLGVCFGAQMLSAALGGQVTRSARPEIGWVEIDSVDTGLVPRGPWMQWHSDCFTVPEGGVELARSEAAIQAFQFGSALGIQFHPEVDTVIVARWVTSGERELRANGLAPEDVMADSARYDASARTDAFALLDAFWRAVGARGFRTESPRAIS